MTRLMMFSGGTAAFALVVTLLWFQREPTHLAPASVDPHASHQHQESTAQPSETEHPSPTSIASSPTELIAERTPDAAMPEEDESSEDADKMFRADEAGNLLLAERTRLNIEKLSALYTPEDRQQRLAVIERTLPASAYRQLVDLMERHDNFTRDSKQALPPGREASTVEEAIAHHDSLHALRVAHFGAEAAEALYGHEERIGRQLLDFMSLEKHEGMTMEEKAMRAQEMLLRSPELLAAYEKNRTAKPAQK